VTLLEENINFKKPTVLLIIGENRMSEDFFRIYSLIYYIKLFHRTDLFFDRIKELKPDIIILSFIPSDNIDGFKILNSMISDTTFNSVPIISIIEDEVEEHIHLVLEKGSTEYLTKGNFFNLIRHKINALLRIINNNSNKLNQHKNELKNILISDYDKQVLSQFITEVNNIIEKDINISINEIAKNLHVTLNFLEKKVKDAFGNGPRRYILDKRLEKADLFLKTKKTSIKNIAFELGFNSTAYFTKCYRIKYGKTPKSSKIDSIYN
jgi:AraC-like DNA-binding protein